MGGISRNVQRSLIALLVLLTFVAMMGVSSAASLGEVRAQGMKAFAQPVSIALPDCQEAVTLYRVTQGTALVAVVGYGTDSCAGQPIQIELWGGGSTPIYTADGLISAPTFTVHIDREAPIQNASVTDLVATVGGDVLPEVAKQESFSISLNDWGTAYRATVTIATTSSTPVVWDYELLLGTYPLTAGDECNHTNAVVEVDNDLLSATGEPWNDEVVSGTTQSFEFCIQRGAPPAGVATATLYNLDYESPTRLCASVDVTTTSGAPIEWTVYVDLDTSELRGTLIPSRVTNAAVTQNSTTWELTATGVAWNKEIQSGQTRTWGFCVDRVFDPPPAGTITTSVVYKGQPWSSGYNANVTVSTTSTTPVGWQDIEIDLSAFGTGGNVTSGQAVVTWQSPILIASRPSWAPLISAGKSYTFEINANGITPP